MKSSPDLRNFNQALPVIQSSLDQLHLCVDHEQVEKLFHFVCLLDKWNRAYNLTSIRDVAEMYPAHIWDSLAISPFLKGSHCLDIGTGGGLPGVPLAIVNPDVNFTLLDSNGKKTRFVQQVKTELKLANVEVVHARLESSQLNTQFDTLVTRAVATMDKLIPMAGQLFGQNSQFLFLKSREVNDELQHLGDEYVKKLFELQVPDLNAQRFLVRVSHNRPSMG